MRTALRVAVSLVVFVATSYVVSFVAAIASLPLQGDRASTASWLVFLVSLLCGLWTSRFTFRHLGQVQRGAPLRFQSSVLVGALLGGSLAFVLGFFGPMIVTPESNLGPLLGFFTGPVGAVLGAVGGGLYNSLVVRKGRA